MTQPNSNVTKIVITPYLDQKESQQAGPAFTIPVNPESYSLNYKIELEKKPTGGNQGTSPKYKYTAPEHLKLDFIFDNTGTIEGNTLNGTSVYKQVEDLKKALYYMQGKAHKPAYLKIIWGRFIKFHCVLESLESNYILFKPDGDALRAKISVSFTQHKEPEIRVAEEDKKSPDLTHSVKVTEDDKLPQLSFRQYGNSKYYLQLADFNGLMSVRTLPKDTLLVFPPIIDTIEKIQLPANGK